MRHENLIFDDDPVLRFLAHLRAEHAGDRPAEAGRIVGRVVDAASGAGLTDAGIHPLLARLYAARGIRAKGELDDIRANKDCLKMFAQRVEYGEPIEICSCCPTVQQKNCWSTRWPLHLANKCLTTTR